MGVFKLIFYLFKSKLAEQNAQINYLNEENYNLKAKINSLSINKPNSTSNKTKIETINNGSDFSSTSTSSFVCSCTKNNQEEMIDKKSSILVGTGQLNIQNFELCLDNLIRQLLNSLKIQETIRVEYLRFSQRIGSTIDQPSSLEKPNPTNQFFCTSNSWTFAPQEINDTKSISSSKESNSVCGGDLNDQNNTLYGVYRVVRENEETNRLHDLLLKQQNQQLSILTELNKISKCLKSLSFEDNLENILESTNYSYNNPSLELGQVGNIEDEFFENNASSLSNLQSPSGVSMEKNRCEVSKVVNLFCKKSLNESVKKNLDSHHSSNPGE